MSLSMFPVAQPFTFGWTRDDTHSLLLAHRECHRQEVLGHPNAYSDMATVFESLDEQHDRAVIGHVAWLVEQGRFSLPEHADEVQINWLAALRHWLNTPTAGDHDRLRAAQQALAPILSALSFSRTRQLIQVQNQAHTEEGVDQLHSRLVEQVQAGHFRWQDLEEHTCFMSGERIRAQTVDWTLTLGLRGPDRFFHPLRAGQIARPPLTHVTIDCPSGELLISDWFRLPAFQAATQCVDNPAPLSLQSEAGRVARTLLYAQQMGFASVYVGDHAPEIAIVDDCLAIGSLAERAQSPTVTLLGSVLTDFHLATLIDRETLVRIAAQNGPREQGLVLVEAMEVECAQQITRLRVAPGTYHLYFAGDPSSFQAQFNMQELSLGAFSLPMLVLSPEPLTPMPTSIDPSSIQADVDELRTQANTAPSRKGKGLSR